MVEGVRCSCQLVRSGFQIAGGIEGLAKTHAKPSSPTSSSVTRAPAAEGSGVGPNRGPPRPGKDGPSEDRDSGRVLLLDTRT